MYADNVGYTYSNCMQLYKQNWPTIVTKNFAIR